MIQGTFFHYFCRNPLCLSVCLDFLFMQSTWGHIHKHLHLSSILAIFRTQHHILFFSETKKVDYKTSPTSLNCRHVLFYEMSLIFSLSVSSPVGHNATSISLSTCTAQTSATWGSTCWQTAALIGKCGTRTRTKAAGMWYYKATQITTLVYTVTCTFQFLLFF